MVIWFRVVARTIAYRFPLILGTLRFFLKQAQRIREFKNVNSLLTELHSDTALQLPLLVEQNRRMFREVESLRIEVARLQQLVETGKSN